MEVNPYESPKTVGRGAQRRETAMRFDGRRFIAAFLAAVVTTLAMDCALYPFVRNPQDQNAPWNFWFAINLPGFFFEALVPHEYIDHWKNLARDATISAVGWGIVAGFATQLFRSVKNP